MFHVEQGLGKLHTPIVDKDVGKSVGSVLIVFVDERHPDTFVTTRLLALT